MTFGFIGTTGASHARMTEALPSGAAFTRASTAYQTEPDGSLSVVAINTPRFNAAGVLIERPWTNLNAAPEAIDGWVEQQAGGDAPVDANVATAPDGTATADRVNYAGALAPDVGRSEYDVGLVNGALYMTSIYVRRDSAPHDFRVVNPNAPADNVVNGVATANWQRVSRLDTVTGTVSGIYVRRDSSPAGGSLMVWGGARYANDFGHVYEYHPTGLAAEKLTMANSPVDARQGTVGLTWVPQFAATADISGAAEQIIRSISLANFSLRWAANVNPAYVVLYNNGVLRATLATRHAAGDELRLRVHYGGRPTMPHLECNGWATLGNGAWVEPVIPANGAVGSTFAGTQHCWGRYRDVFSYRIRHSHARRFASLGDSISTEPYGSATGSWNRPFGLLLEAVGGYVLVAGYGGDTLALMLARVANSVTDQDIGECVVLGGVNDLVAGRTLAQMKTDALAIYAALAVAGVRVIACSILPFKGNAGWTAGREAIRVAFNAWLATLPLNVGVFVDTAAALADPLDSEQLAAAYDSGDFTHPSDAGGVAIANAVWAAVQ